MAVNIDELEDSLDSIEIGIEMELEEITHPYSKCRHLGGLIWGLVDLYRSRAILKFLLRADIKAFFEDLNREALTYVTLLKSFHNGYDVDKSRVNGSTFFPLCCAIAAANDNLAQEADKLMPEEMSQYDSEELFAYTNLIRSLIRQDDETTSQKLSSFKQACQGFLRYDHKIQALEAIIRKDAEGFNQGLKSYLESFEHISVEEAEEMDPGDEYIDIESLAYIQLAKRNKMPVLIRHALIPEELQSPRPILPDTGYPKWPG